MDRPLSNPEDLTPKRLTSILRKEGVLGEGEVTGVRVILSKTLHVSRVARLSIEYSSDTDAAAPLTLFLKLSKNDSARPAGPGDGSEVEFYKLVGSTMPEGMIIRCYDAVFSPDEFTSHLLFEDLSDTHFQPMSGQLPSPAFCRQAVVCLARFHAHWHGDPRIGREIGVVFDISWLKTFTRELEESVDKFIDFLGDELTAERRKAYELLVRNSQRIWGRLTDAEGLTVTNGDAHWWNFMYPKDPLAHEIKLFDWQLWHIDLGARDLAFLVALGGFAQRRLGLEKALTRKYHEVLVASGVGGYSWNDFWRDYQFSAVRNLNIPVIYWSRGRSREEWGSLLERAFASYNELRCAEILE